MFHIHINIEKSIFVIIMIIMIIAEVFSDQISAETISQ